MGACLGTSAAGPAGVVPPRDTLSIDEIRVQLAEKRNSEGLLTLALGRARSAPGKKLARHHQRTKHTFQVVVDGQPGDNVGAVLSNLAGASSGAAVVFLREGGLLNAWNKSSRTKRARVCVGDIIVKANDAVGFWNILEECSKPGERVLTLERRRFGQELLFRLRLVMQKQLQDRVSQVCFWERKAADDGSRGKSGKSGSGHSAPSRLEQRPQLMQLSRASADDDARCLLCKGGAGEQASLAQMPCGHAFHNSCICTWMCQNEPRCPECSANLSDTLLGTPFAVEDCV